MYQNIIKKIANIQLEALSIIKHNPDDMLLMDHPLKDFMSVYIEEMRSNLDEKISLYNDILKDPFNIASLSPFQLDICAYILFRMEPEWLLEDPVGVVEVWNKLAYLINSNNPEYVKFN